VEDEGSTKSHHGHNQTVLLLITSSKAMCKVKRQHIYNTETNDFSSLTEANFSPKEYKSLLLKGGKKHELMYHQLDQLYIKRNEKDNVV